MPCPRERGSREFVCVMHDLRRKAITLTLESGLTPHTAVEQRLHLQLAADGQDVMARVEGA